MAGTKGNSGGHNRKTQAEKEKLGTLRKSRRNDQRPNDVNGELIVWKEQLGEHGKKIIEVYGAMLKANGTICITDSMALHRFARVAEDWYKYDQQCRRLGREIPIKNEDGQTINSEEAGWSKIEMRLDSRLSQCFRELGLAPIHRDCIKRIAVGEKVNKFAL
jgi:hypothetical protein